jgi:hypothetical protein
MCAELWNRAYIVLILDTLFWIDGIGGVISFIDKIAGLSKPS